MQPDVEEAGRGILLSLLFCKPLSALHCVGRWGCGEELGERENKQEEEGEHRIGTGLLFAS